MAIGYRILTADVAAQARLTAAVVAATADRLAGRGMPCFISSSSGKKPNNNLQVKTAAAAVVAAAEAAVSSVGSFDQ
jgi:hypothetical protein